MLNNINNVNNSTAFKANLKINVPVKNAERMANICKIFSERTAKSADTLTVSKIVDEDMVINEAIRHGDSKSGIVVSFKNSIDSMMENLTDNEIATKFVKTLRSFKFINKQDAFADATMNEAYRLQHGQKKNASLANSCREKGDNIMAERFDWIANCLEQKQQKLKETQQKETAKFQKSIENIAKGDEDILDFRRCNPLEWQ